MKEYITGIFIVLVLAIIVYLPNGMSIFKSLDQPLTLSCHCEEASLCQWYYQDQQSVPDHWVKENGDLNLPADDWTVYGGITYHCGADSDAYTIMNPGEVCNTCLQLYSTPSVNGICVDSMANVTISTNQSHSHGDAITLHVNDSVCSSNHHGNDVVRCREHGNVIGHTLSYTIIAIDDGTVTMRAQTSYYGATWYSMIKTITVVEQCNENLPADHDIINTTNVTTTPPTSDDVITANDPTSSEEIPTSSSTDNSSSGGSAVPEQPTSKVNISGNMEDDDHVIIIIAPVIIGFITIIAIVICIGKIVVTFCFLYYKNTVVFCCCWKSGKKKNLNIDQQGQQQPAHVSSVHRLITGLPSCSNSSQESAQDYCC